MALYLKLTNMESVLYCDGAATVVCNLIGMCGRAAPLVAGDTRGGCVRGEAATHSMLSDTRQEQESQNARRGRYLVSVCTSMIKIPIPTSSAGDIQICPGNWHPSRAYQEFPFTFPPEFLALRY